ncbi:phage tail protein, partial [Halobiforma nitratireducens]
MTFSYTVTTSESDWRDWGLRNVRITDGGVALRETTAVRSRTIDDSIVDVTADRAGVRYLLTQDGAVYRYEETSDTRELVIDGTPRGEWDPRSITTSGSRVFVIDGDGVITAVDPETRREIETFETLVADPRKLISERGTLYALDSSGTIVSIRGDEQEASRSSKPTVDVATSPDGVAVITTAEDENEAEAEDEDEHELWRIRTDQDDPTSEKLLAGDDFAAETPFTPTAIAIAGPSLVIAGRCKSGDEHALFEFEPETAQFSRLTTLENAGAIETLVGRVSDDGRRSFYAVDAQDRCFSLTERIEYLERPDGDTHAGLAVTRYDGGSDQLEWHRLVVDLARFPPNTRVRLRYYATDEPLLPVDGSGSPGESDRPATRNRGSERSAERKRRNETPANWTQTQFDPADAPAVLQGIGVSSGLELIRTAPERLAARHESLSTEPVKRWQRTAFDALETHAESEWNVAEVADNPDVLLRNATGRYLYVALELVGTPTASPHVDTVTAYCPRQSYLRYMPELYQEDDRSAAFLERFLSVFETSFVDVQSEIDGITQYFDPHGVPSDSLAWLEEWLAADEYREWPESARREYLARAPELYKLRGTRAGLREVIELYLRHAAVEGPEPTTGSDREPELEPKPEPDSQPDTDDSETPTDTTTGHRL